MCGQLNLTLENLEKLICFHKISMDSSSSRGGKYHSLLVFSVEVYDSWKFIMANHLGSLSTRMMEVFNNGHIMIYHTNNEEVADQDHHVGAMILKSTTQMDVEERNVFNLDQVAINIILKIVNNVHLGKIRYCRPIKAVWDILDEMCEGNDQIKESKLQRVNGKL